VTGSPFWLIDTSGRTYANGSVDVRNRSSWLSSRARKIWDAPFRES